MCSMNYTYRFEKKNGKNSINLLFTGRQVTPPCRSNLRTIIIFFLTTEHPLTLHYKTFLTYSMELWWFPETIKTTIYIRGNLIKNTKVSIKTWKCAGKEPLTLTFTHLPTFSILLFYIYPQPTYPLTFTHLHLPSCIYPVVFTHLHLPS